MRKIALINQKGGVGKTTSTASIAAALSLEGKKVLLVDLDPQGNLSISLEARLREDSITIYEVLTGECTAEEALIRYVGKNYDLIGSDIRLSGAEFELSGQPGREMILKEALAPIVSNYDYVLYDCPPSLGLLTLNALAAADEIFIPLQPEFLALNGISQLLNTVGAVQRRINPSLTVTGIIITMFDGRKNLNKEVLETVRSHLGDIVFNTFIRNNVALAEAPSFGQDIFEYSPRSNGAIDYMNLTKEILEQERRT